MQGDVVKPERRAYVNCDDRHLDAFMKYVTLSDGLMVAQSRYSIMEKRKGRLSHWQFKEEPKWCA